MTNFAIAFARMILIGLFAAWTVIYGISPALAVLGIQLRDRGLVDAATTVIGSCSFRRSSPHRSCSE